MEKSLEACLYEDLKNGNTKRAVHIVKLFGDNVDALYKGKSLLIWAKEFKNEDVINALEGKGANEVVISKEEAERLGGELIPSAKEGDLDKVEQLIDAGADLNIKDKYGNTALLLASRKGHTEIVDKLISCKANLDLVDNYGWTALMEASYKGYTEIVEKLIDVGADVNVKNVHGKKVIRVAKDKETKRAIIEAIKAKNAKDKENEPSITDRLKGFFGMGDK